MATRASKRQRAGHALAQTSSGSSSAGAAARRLRDPCCTFAKHGETFVEQRFYECVTCELTLENGTGICRACKRSCHAGHDVGFVGRIKAYCDCGRSGCDLAANRSASAECSESSGEEGSGEEDACEPFVDPRLSRNYADKKFWDERYSCNKETDDTDEWLVGYADIEQVLKPQLLALTANVATPTASGRDLRSRRGAAAANGRPQLLMLGCGDSQFSSDLYDAGFPHITNIDISAVCIEMMRGREAKRRPEMKWAVADCTDLSQFADGTFDVVIDKTMLDALCCSAEAVDLVPKMLKEVGRVLAKGGAYILISFSLESAKASFEQAVLTEAVFASFKPLSPTVTMVVSAEEDTKRRVTTAITAASSKAQTAKKAKAATDASSVSAAHKGDGAAKVHPVEFCICFLGQDQ